MQVARAEVVSSVKQIENEVEVVYQRLSQSQRLVEAYRAGARGRTDSFRIVEHAHLRGGATLLKLLDAARTPQAVQQNSIEALFGYQRNFYQLVSTVGRDIH